MSKKRLIYGVGLNDLDEPVKINNIHIKSYKAWVQMLRRCYSNKLHLASPTYKECEVSYSWHKLSIFKEWFDANYIEGYELDKDLLGDGKLYSPNTCCFVPGWINTIFSGFTRKRKYPMGVYFYRKTGKYRAQYNVNNKRTCLGYYVTPEEAHEAYKAAKKAYVLEKIADYPDERVKQAVIRKINAL